MAVTPWKSPASAGRSGSGWGGTGTDWTAAAISAAGGDFTGCLTGNADGQQADLAWAYGFGFAADIPAGATIDGIEVRDLAGTNNSSRYMRLDQAYLIFDGATGTASGTSQATQTPRAGTAYSAVTHGGAANKWGLTPTRDQVVAPAFGVRLIYARDLTTGAGNFTWAEVDHVEMRVHYTEGGGGGITGSGSGGFDAGATATGEVGVSGQGSGSFGLDAASAGAVGVTGSGSGSFEAQSSGGASTGVQGSASGGFQADASGTGQAPVSGTASGGFDADASGSGAAPITGTGEGGFAANATSEGSALQPGGGSASGSFTTTADGTGEVAISGEGNAGFASAATASGGVSVSGDAAGAFSTASDATGEVRIAGDGSGAFAAAASGAGVVGGAVTPRAPLAPEIVSRGPDTVITRHNKDVVIVRKTA